VVRGGTLTRERAAAGSLDPIAPVVTRPASVDALPPVDAVNSSPPRRVQVPALGVDAEVVAVGVSSDGTLEVPAHPSIVGWYMHGAAPGAPAGSVVLASHVDTAAAGPGVFFELRTLDTGADVRVQREDGTEVRYTTVARMQFPKDELPNHDLFDVGGAPRLVLITCGGEFDETRRSYADNVVLIAAPVPDAPA
jgi:hypothetical protein